MELIISLKLLIIKIYFGKSDKVDFSQIVQNHKNTLRSLKVNNMNKIDHENTSVSR